jgi:uncharacterized membrane protein YhiD involved in acid resistance
MNFNFKIIDLENIVFTLMEMRTGIFVLATIAGIHTFTILCWFGYKYFNEPKELPKELTTNETETETESETQETQDIQMEPVEPVEENVDNSDNSVMSEDQKNNLEKELYHNMVMFEDKKNQLEELIEKLSKIQNNLEVVREKLTELNNSR